MDVNPAILRAFNEQVQTASGAIAAEDTGKKVSTAADGLNGSTTQWACRAIGQHIAGIEKGIAKNVSDEGVAVRGVGNTFEVADNVLHGQLDGLFN